MTVIQRPLKGARISTFYPVKSLPPLASLDSAFQLQEYISLLIRLDVHDVEAIVSVPGKFGTKEREGSDDMRGQERDVERDLKSDVAVDESCWIYEQLRRLAQDLSHPLITTLQQECTRQTCPEMKAGEWLYLCVAHGNDGNMEQCCAIDYILHTLDSATALLNSPRAFPSRLSIPPTSNRHFSSLARRLGRIFAHAYFHHREAFEQAEAESSLYARFLTLTMKFDLVPAEFLFRPSPMNTMHDEHDERDEDPGRGAGLQYDSARERDRRQWLNLNDSSSAMDIGLSSGRGLSPPGPAGTARNPSPRKGRNRTDTMVHSEAINVAEELAKDGGFSEADLDRAIAEERMLTVDQGIPEVTVTEPTSVEVYEPGSESQLPTEPPTEPVAEAFNVEEHAEVDQQQEEQSAELIPTQRETSPELSEEILDIAAPPPAEPSPPESDDEDSPVAEGPVSHILDDTPVPEVEMSEETAAEQAELIEEALQWEEELAGTTEALAEEEQPAEETESIVEEGEGSDGLGSEEEPRALELEEPVAAPEIETAGVEVIEQEPRDSPVSPSDILEVDVEQAEESQEAVAKEPEAGEIVEESPGSEPSEEALEAHSSSPISETIGEDSQNAEKMSEEKPSADPVTQDPPPEES
ncbi:hypothetical protein PHLCEN_2v3284 [Hermanssonia centrifuga]|uniref:Mob1/phocein n=1 Tax=Hermanssonia centrifuga TaxID=98765 RepID=A0A2R6QUI6_9APHY|nr:hypothetical protein PHLCEN_2v3284 [Hermanssonia centrifuga]